MPPQEFDTPCYVVQSDGWRLHVYYRDDWCYGPSASLGRADSDAAARAVIAEHIRARFTERNRLPLYAVSDHGNITRPRRVTLRRPTA